MKLSFVVLSVATLFAHTTFAQPSASISANQASASSSVAAQPEQSAPVTLPTGQIDFSKMDPEELETIYQEIEEDALLEDMVKSGWPEQQAQMVLSLSDIVESLTQVPEEDAQNQQITASFAAVRETMRDLLASAGLDFHATDESGRGFSRVMTTKKAYSPKTVVTIVHGLVDLMRTASKFTAMLGNPTFSQYGMMISSAVQMIENLLGTAKGLLAPDLPTVNIAPQ